MARDTPNPLARRWMRLGEALNEVMTIPLSEGDAKRVLCNAIADKRIEIELGLKKHVTRHMTVPGVRFSGAEFHIPKELDPQTIDFENSRPLEPWFRRWEGHPHMGGQWHVDWLEVDRAGVAELVRSASPTGNRKQAQRRKKTQTAREGMRGRLPWTAIVRITRRYALVNIDIRSRRARDPRLRFPARPSKRSSMRPHFNAAGAPRLE